MLYSSYILSVHAWVLTIPLTTIASEHKPGGPLYACHCHESFNAKLM